MTWIETPPEDVKLLLLLEGSDKCHAGEYCSGMWFVDGHETHERVTHWCIASTRAKVHIE